MVLAYYRLGKFEDARRSMLRLLTFADRFRMDNPLTKCGSDVYQPNEPINLCYDSFGPAAAFMRGLFEYLYRADGLTLVPHVPPGITELQQLDPVRFGTKRVLLSTSGAGPITAVKVNGRKWKQFDQASVFLPYAKTPELAKVQIILGDAKQSGRASSRAQTSPPVASNKGSWAGSPAKTTALAALESRAMRLREFERRLRGEGLGGSYEAAHARLAEESVAAARLRGELIESGKLQPLPDSREVAADRACFETATRLCDGLESVLKGYANAADPQQKRSYAVWQKTGP